MVTAPTAVQKRLAEKAAKQPQVLEADASIEERLADINQEMGKPFSRDTIADAAASVAATYDIERDEITGGDLTATAAQAITAAAHAHNEPADRPTLQSELQALGDPVLRPEGILSRDEERARDERNRAEIMMLMSAPSSKRIRQLQALKESPPFSFYCPIDIPDGYMNGVPVIIYEGMIKPKTPGTIGLGCLMVAQFVEHVIGRRGWATTDSRRLKLQEILDPEVDESRHANASRPAAGIY